MKKTLLKTLLLTCLLGVWGANAQAATLEDVITPEAIGYTSGSSYTDVTYTGTSGTNYVGHLIVKEGYIQMRSSSSDTGLWTTLSIGYARKIVITWNTEQSTASRTLDIYGNSTPYSAASDLYSSSTQGTRIGQITNDNTTATLEITGDYPYIAFRSNSGALYLAEIEITWEEAEIDNPEPEPEPSGHGYEPDDPYSASEAKELIAALGAGGTIPDIYVKGTISQIDEVSTSYGNATYWISDDGTTTDQLEIYRGYYLENTSFTSEDAIKVGDEVIVYGTFVYYNGTTPQGQSANTYIYSLNGETEAPGEEHNGEVDFEGTTVDLINPNVTAGTETTSIDFTTMGFENATSLDGETLEFEDGSTVTFSKGTNTNNGPTYYTSGTAIRVYVNNTLTFSSNKVIAKIEMHCTATSYEGNQSTEVVDFSDDGKSAVYCNAGTDNTQLRVMSITITYAGESAGTTEGSVEHGESMVTLTNTGVTAGTETASFDVTSITDLESGASVDGTIFELSDGGTIVFEKATGSSAPAYYTSSGNIEIRVYFNNTITFTCSKKIANIIMTTESNSYEGSNDETVTFYDDGTSAVFCNVRHESENTQLRVTSIVVTYADESATGSFSISSAGYATYYTDAEYTMPEGVMGTTVTGKETKTGDDGGYILDMTWGYVAGSTVPAGTALLLKGSEGTYTYTITSTEATAPTDNLLLGSTEDVEKTYGPDGETEGYVFYKLTYGSTEGHENVFGFYWGEEDGAAFESPANKAWLAVPASQASNIKFFSLDGEGDTTGISTVESAEGESSDAIYTIQGVRVNDMTHRGIYIVNGKKILVK